MWLAGSDSGGGQGVGRTVPTRARLAGTVPDAVLELDASKQQGGAEVRSNTMAGNVQMTFSGGETLTEADGIRAWDLNDAWLERTGGPELKHGQRYTHAYVAPAPIVIRCPSALCRSTCTHPVDQS